MLALVLYGKLTYTESESPEAPEPSQLLQHYGPETYNKNFMYKGDNWLFVKRWEHLIANRAHVNMVEVLTWSASLNSDLGALSQDAQAPLSRRLRRVSLHWPHRRRTTDVGGLGEWV